MMKIFHATLACLLLLSNVRVAGQMKAIRNVKELEVVVMGGASEGGALIMFQALYRIPIAKGSKLGFGASLSGDRLTEGVHPGVFIDYLKFLGKEDKWSFNAQFGPGFYDRTFSFSGVGGAHYSTKEYRERELETNISFRGITWKNGALSLGGYYFLQSYKTYTQGTDISGQPLNPFYSRNNYSGGGLRVGLLLYSK